ncbi:GH92 family glycosyl hydrolase [uncultured Porphyromonas sp.]|uniref:GH92 family glycosyl hydrolase n=1 Tax=uncultured Porphyromonas sp. TaxID=159274 RepID=UPI00262DD309|nr:GH92 family glycosyl hydrolase [uncultured Porphyromonas sp.]
MNVKLSVGVGLCLCLPPLYSCGKSTKEELIIPDPERLYELVDPFVGTGFHGHTFPGATAPMGMVQLSPETRWEGWDACAGYHYDDDSLYGFAHTHLSGTGCSDLGDVIFLPTIDSERYTEHIDEERLPKVGFSHDREKAHAGYYSVELENGIKAELTASSLMGVHRYTYPKGAEEASLLIDLVNIKGDEIVESGLEQTSESTLRGYTITNGWVPRQHVYFAAHLSRPIREAKLFLNGEEVDGLIARGDSIRAILSLDAGDEGMVEIFVGLSQTSMEAAEANLNAELSRCGATFDQVQADTEKQWSSLLSKVKVKEGKKEDLTCLYTALYHSLVAPNRISDADGSYRGMDDEIHRASGVSYSTLSLWDTFRAEHPLLTLLFPEVVPDLCRSMMQMYREGGELPIWPLYGGETRTMIGYHAVSVLADAYLSGQLGNLDPLEVLKAMIKSSNINKKGSDAYSRLGFIPANTHNESVSCTLEYAYDDWCIARMAEALGETEIADTYYQRAQNYTHLFDGSTKFFRGRHEDGSWGADFDPYELSKDYTEANGWQYRFAPMHDVEGMIALHGGAGGMLDALDNLFSDTTPAGDLQDITGLIGQYAHGNEPSHHLSFLYNYLGRPSRTQELTRQILDELYDDTPEGISGNEDCGQMSAWYLFTALGLYPVTPVSGELQITTPRFREVTLTLPKGKLTITTDKDPAEYPYVRFISLNGKELHRLFVTIKELTEGGTLAFTLSDKPVDDFVVEERPYSMTRKDFVSPVYSSDDITLFHDQVSVSLASATPGATIYYTIDEGEKKEYTGTPITLTRSATLRAYAEKDGLDPSPTTTLIVTKAEYAQAQDVSSVADGADWTLHAGAVESTDQIASLPIIGRGVCEQPSIEMRDREDLFALTFTGFIQVPETDVYEFRLTSDDGSVLRIHDRPIVLNDGSHAFVSATGKVALSRGLHPFTLVYWQGAEGKGLRLEYRRRGQTDYTTPTLKHK